MSSRTIANAAERMVQCLRRMKDPCVRQWRLGPLTPSDELLTGRRTASLRPVACRGPAHAHLDCERLRFRSGFANRCAGSARERCASPLAASEFEKRNQLDRAAPKRQEVVALRPQWRKMAEMIHSKTSYCVPAMRTARNRGASVTRIASVTDRVGSYWCQKSLFPTWRDGNVRSGQAVRARSRAVLKVDTRR